MNNLQFVRNQKWGLSILSSGSLYSPAGKSTAKALRLAMANIAEIAMIKKKRRVKKHTINLKIEIKYSSWQPCIKKNQTIYHGTSRKLFRAATPVSINIEAKVKTTK